MSILPVNVLASELAENKIISEIDDIKDDDLDTFLYDENGNLIEFEEDEDVNQQLDDETTNSDENILDDEIILKDEDSSGSQDNSSCNCGSIYDVHDDTCPLYIVVEDPPSNDSECTCGSETDDHSEDCPLYEKSIDETCECIGDIHEEGCKFYEEVSPICECPDGIHIETCHLYEPSVENEKTCTCGSEDGVHTRDCVLYEEIEEGLCTCGTEDNNHLIDCPLYEKPVINFNYLVSIDSLSELYNILYNQYEVIATFTNQEKELLLTHVSELYNSIEEPTENDTQQCDYLTNIINSYIIVICECCGQEDGLHLDDCEFYICDECGSKEHTEDCSKFVEIDIVCSECNEKNGVHLETCSQFVSELTVFEILLNSNSLDGFYEILLSDEYFDYVLLLTADEIIELKEHVQFLYSLINEPTEEDSLLEEEIIETLSVLPNGGEESEAEILANWTGQTSGTYTLSGTVTISSTVKITGKLIISGTGTIKRGSGLTGDLFYISGGGSLTITGTNGNIIIDGNSPYKQGSNVSGATANGSLIRCAEANVYLDSVTLQNNFAAGYAGGIEANASSTASNVISLINCRIVNCASVNGSAIYLKSSGKATVNLTDTTIENCWTHSNGSGEGGTIRTNGGGHWKLTLDGCNIINNYSHSHGGGLYWNANGSASQLTVKNTVLSGNVAVNNGGAAFLEGTKMSFESGTYIENNSAKIGGGICINSYGGGNKTGMGSTDSCNVNLSTGVYIQNNTATTGAGVAYNIYKSDPEDGYTYNLTISGAILQKNEATNGGAVAISNGYSWNGSTGYRVNLMFDSGEIYNNIASNNGGGAYISGGSVSISGGSIADNTATNNGGGLYVYGGNIEMADGVLDNNEAGVNGGAIYVASDSSNITLDIYDGEITNNSAGNHGGAIGVNVSGNYSVSLNIGEEDCAGVNTHLHDDGDCPVIENNVANKYGGAFCLHGNSNSLFVNVYCGEIVNNTAERYPGSNTINQSGGKFTIYGGDTDPGIMVGGGIFEDNRVDAQEIKVRFWGNYDGAPTEPVIIECTLGVTLNFPIDTYTNGTHELSGWTNVPNGKDGWVPVGGQYTIYEDDDEFIDYYAVWDAVVSYIVYIPDECHIASDGVGTIDISADLSYFKKDSNLEVFLISDFLLVNTLNYSDVISFIIETSEFGVGGILSSGDLAASWQYDNVDDKILTLTVPNNGSINTSGNYTNVITFNVVYSE